MSFKKIDDPVARAIKRNPTLRFSSKFIRSNVKTLSDRFSSTGLQMGLGQTLTGGISNRNAEQAANDQRRKPFTDRQHGL